MIDGSSELKWELVNQTTHHQRKELILCDTLASTTTSAIVCFVPQTSGARRSGKAASRATRPPASLNFSPPWENPPKWSWEACWNWGWLYDLLDEIPQVEEVVLAHPYKTRLIAEAP